MKTLILSNRSLAENNPLNLVALSEVAKSYLKKHGEIAFIDHVNKVLDDNE